MSLQASFVEKQKEFLLAEKAKLEKKIAQLKKYPDYGPDEEDNLQELADYESNLSIDEQMEYLMGKINKALKAIENGTYGQCAECQQNIEQGRLDIIPYADLCVSCRSKHKSQ